MKKIMLVSLLIGMMTMTACSGGGKKTATFDDGTTYEFVEEKLVEITLEENVLTEKSL